MMEPKGQPRSILIVKTSSLGDVIHTFPAVHLLRRLFPNAKLDWLVNPAFAPIVATHPDVDRVIHYPRKDFSSILRCLPSACSLTAQIRENAYDAVIDFQGLIRTAVFTGLSGAPQRIGFAAPREKISAHFYNCKITVPENLHAVEKNIALVNEMFHSRGDLIWPKLRLPDAAVQTVAAFLPSLTDGTRTVGIIPGARWESKKWPPEFFACLMKAASKYHTKLRFVIIGGPEEAKDAETIIADADGCNIVNAVGKTDTAGLLALIRDCDAVVSGDTGPLHIAVAQSVPVFALFGPNNPAYSGPIGSCHRVYRAELECAPCMKRRCPIDRATPPCHATLNPEKIASELITLWE